MGSNAVKMELWIIQALFMVVMRLWVFDDTVLLYKNIPRLDVVLGSTVCAYLLIC